VTKSGAVQVHAPLILESGAAFVSSGGALALEGAPSMGSGARIDLTNTALTVDYTGDSVGGAIESQLKTAYNSGVWDGPGIGTSSATPATGLGWLDDAGNQDVIVKYTCMAMRISTSRWTFRTSPRSLAAGKRTLPGATETSTTTGSWTSPIWACSQATGNSEPTDRSTTPLLLWSGGSHGARARITLARFPRAVSLRRRRRRMALPSAAVIALATVQASARASPTPHPTRLTSSRRVLRPLPSGSRRWTAIRRARTPARLCRMAS